MAPIVSCTVTVEEVEDGDCRFVFDLVDDAGNNITGEWSGAGEAIDLSGNVSSLAAAAWRDTAWAKAVGAE
mgnify:FL=1